ncbi:MAG: SIR2 family protein [Sphingobacteriales bacterium]|nr:SIR2 family protein [Sphingobacteriales bacterium]
MLKKRQWDSLLNDLQQGRCVLIIGPSLATATYNEAKCTLREIFAQQLCVDLDAESITYDQQQKTNLLYTASKFLHLEGVRRIDLVATILQTYKKYATQIPPIYHELAKLPVPLIINTNPDDFMLRALRQAGKTCTQAWYNFCGDAPHQTDINAFSIQNPLVYNLLGTFDEPRSLVLTENDQVEFVEKIIRGEPPIPPRIVSHFKDPRTYIFYDLDIDNWQFRLLLHTLDLQVVKDNLTFSPKHSILEFSKAMREFYEEHFGFQFIDKNASEFTTELQKSIPKLYHYKPNKFKPKSSG